MAARFVVYAIPIDVPGVDVTRFVPGARGHGPYEEAVRIPDPNAIVRTGAWNVGVTGVSAATRKNSGDKYMGYEIIGDDLLKYVIAGSFATASIAEQVRESLNKSHKGFRIGDSQTSSGSGK